MGDSIEDTAPKSNVEEVKDEVEHSALVDVTDTVTDNNVVAEKTDNNPSISIEAKSDSGDVPPGEDKGDKDNAEDKTVVDDVTTKDITAEDTKNDDATAGEKVDEETSEDTKDNNVEATTEEIAGDNNNNTDEATGEGDAKVDTKAPPAGDEAVEDKTEPTGDEGAKETTEEATTGETKEKSEKKSSDSKEKRKYKQRAPLLKWKNVVREMKLIMFDEAVVLYHQLNRKRDKLSKKLSRKRMADMILNTLGNPPFMSRKHVYAVVSKHAKLQAEAGLDVTDISTLKALPQIQSAVTALANIKSQAKQERLAQRVKEEEEEEAEDEDEEDDDEEEDEPKAKRAYKKQSKKRKFDERLDDDEDDSDLDKKLKKMRKKIKKDKLLSKKEKKRVEKEKRQKLLDAAVEMYFDAKSKLPPDTTVVTGSLITDVIAELGGPDWLTRHHIYHAIIKHQEENPPPSSLGLARAAAKTATTSTAASDAITKIKKRADGTPISDAALGRKKEKLTSAQKKAKLDEAIENATAEYYEARQKAKPNRLREGVLSKIISNSVHQVGLPPKFCALVSFQTIRNRVTKLEQLQNPEVKTPIYKKSSTTTATTTLTSTLPSALLTSKATTAASSAPTPAKSVKFHASSAPPAPLPTSTLIPDNHNNPERDFL